ncbi:unnamed protein product [Bursaphelenchus okinawaensis]|uniref:VASt domain-containing protein n=1 Tax=Bursaphelenchus okinawaensis TaxID=465554 RepID=A0A811JTD0_9BILA|nr:unnamed protein product [Bursaphelenchus okinawaensis]CAG9082161.1 unnamed protein product [Bursaphelenchus okinawaensis]
MKESRTESRKFDLNVPKLQKLGEKLKNFVPRRDSKASRFNDVVDDGLYKTRCLYHSDAGPLLGHLAVFSDNLIFQSYDKTVNLEVLYFQVKYITLSDYGSLKSALQLYKTDDSVTIFNNLPDENEVLRILCNVWRSTHHSLLQTSGGCFMCVPKRVDRTVKVSSDSTSSSSEEFAMSKRSHSRPDVTAAKTAPANPTPTATTDTASQSSAATSTNAQKEPVSCECDDHKGTVFLDKTYNLDVDELYQILFTDNDSLNNFLKSAKRSDLRYESWTVTTHGDKKRKQRTATYTVELNNTLGPKCTHVTEVQAVVAEMGPNASDGYIITKDAVNAGVPYADCFSVLCKYCITRVGPKQTRLQVHGEVIYRKSVMSVFKSIIEKMTLSGMHDYYKNLDKYLSSCGSKESHEHRNGAGSDWVSEFQESELDTQPESESIVSQEFNLCEIRLHKELVRQRHDIRVQASYLREIRNSLRLVVVLLVLVLLVLVGTVLFPAQTGSILKSSQKQEL